MRKLENESVLITGGTRGIGLATAQEFEREGARVAICGTDEKALKEARSTLGPNALAGLFSTRYVAYMQNKLC